MRLAIAGIRKYWTRSATILSLVLAVGFVALEFVLAGVGYRSASGGTTIDKATATWLLTFPDAFDAILAIAFEFVAIIGLIYVATASGSEWTWGTLKVAVARGHSRWGYTLSTFGSLAIIVLVGLALGVLAGVVGVAMGASIAGFPMGNPLDLSALPQFFVKFARAGIGIVALTSVGYAAAMVAKNQMAGIGTVIVYFIFSIVAPALLPQIVRDILRYQPFSTAADAIGLSGPPTTVAATSTTALDPNVALAITVAWLVGLLAVAAISVQRAEVTG